MNKLISFIISTRGKKWETLEKAVVSIVSESQVDLEIIIVDQNDDEELKRHLVENGNFGGRVVYFKMEDVGLSKGRNQGVKLCSGEWIVFFDDDAVLEPGALTMTKNTLLQTKNDVIVYYGNILNLENDRNYLRRGVRSQDLNLFNFDGACSIGMIFNRQVIKQVGDFDEMFGVGGKYGAGEESDYLIRVLDKGFKIKYLKDFTVRHPRSPVDINKAQNYGYGLGAMYAKHVNFTSHLVLLLKFLGEIFGRLFFSVFYCLGRDKNRAMFHRQYLKSFLKGYRDYVSS